VRRATPSRGAPQKCSCEQGKTMQWDTIADQWLWLSAAAVILAFVGAFAIYSSNKPKPHDAKNPYDAIQDRQEGWTPTGRIDFSNSQSPGDFILQAEDTRIVDSIGGVEHREIRWRKATLDEAKAVVVAYYAQRNLAMAANFVVRSSNSGEPRQEAQLGKEEAPEEKSEG
jgi:hypothetical protein